MLMLSLKIEVVLFFPNLGRTPQPSPGPAGQRGQKTQAYPYYIFTCF